MTDTRKVQLAGEFDATGVRRGTGDAKAAIRELGTEAEAAGKKAAAGIGGIGEGGQQAAAKVDRTAKSIIASIERANVTLKAGERGTADWFEALGKQRGVSADVLAPYLADLRKTEEAQRRAREGLNGMQVSARQTAAALRQVPAQFTDIVTGLAGGQSPLTVILQQGGQLKDMFGGAGNAAKAIGGYVIGLITPMTLVVAGALGIAAAFIKASVEVGELQRALILSGNAAGYTASQTSAMASRLGAAGAGSVGQAVEVLSQLAGAGTNAAIGIERIADAALRLEKVGGPAASKTVDAFVELGKKPLEGSLKLNESTNFLTASLYLQIKALEEAGRTTEAARLAQEAYRVSVVNASEQIVGSLSGIELVWLKIKQATAGALDQLMASFRGTALQKDLAEVTAQIAELDKAGQKGYVFGPSRAQLAEKQAFLQEQLRLEMRGADAAAQRARGVEAEVAWQKKVTEYLTKQQQLAREIRQIQELGRAAGKSPDAIQQMIAAAREKFAEKKDGGDPFASERDAAKLWAKYFQEFSNAADVANGKVGQLTASQVKLQQFLESPAYTQMAEPARQLALQEAYAAIEAERLAEATKKAAEAAKQLAINKAGDASTLEGIVRSGRVEAQNAGLGDRARAEEAAVEAMSQRFTQRQARLDAEYQSGRLQGQKAAYEAELNQLITAEGQQEAAMREAFARRRAVEADWSTGASRAFANYRDTVANTAEQVDQLLANGFRGAEDALVRFVTTGKLSFKSFADSVVADVARILIRQQITGPLAAMLGAGGGSGGSSVGGFFQSALSAIFGGGKASGGDVQAGRLYEVNERAPELLTVNGRTALMMGSQSGTVTPAGAWGGATVHNTFVLQQPADRRTQQQIATLAGQSISRATRRNG